MGWHPLGRGGGGSSWEARRWPVVAALCRLAVAASGGVLLQCQWFEVTTWAE
jgi:hypothetical protein